MTGSYTHNQNYKKHLPTLLNRQAAASNTPSDTLFSFALRAPSTSHSKTPRNVFPSQLRLLDNADVYRCNMVLRVDPVEGYTENTFDLSQGMFSSDHNSRKQLEHSRLWDHQQHV